MNLNELPFNTDEMLAGIRTWVECESPTYDAASVDRMMNVAAREIALAGAQIEHIPGRMGFGGCIRARFGSDTSGRPGILILGHLDTVHPIGTLQKLAFRREGEKCYGPGIFDMKSGNYIALDAIRKLQRAGAAFRLPVTMLLTSDEEIGSPSTRDLIEAEARRNKYVLVPEPARPNGGVVSGRYAIQRFKLESIGRPSHAGARLSEGRSAIRIMADMIPTIEAMTTDACTFSVGVIHGGQWVNCVSSSCTGEALTMAKRQADLDAGVERMLALSKSDRNDGQFIVTRTLERPVWEPNARTMALYERAAKIGKSIGLELGHESAGGGSDGNFTGPMDLATLDGLGVRGAGAHTLDEHILVESLGQRARLMAGLLLDLD